MFFIKELPKYQNDLLVLHYFLIIFLGLVIVNSVEILPIISSDIFLSIYIPLFNSESTDEFLIDLCKIFYSILRYCNNNEYENLILKSYNHYAGFEQCINLLNDVEHNTEIEKCCLIVLIGMASKCSMVCERIKPIKIKTKIFELIECYKDNKDIQYFLPNVLFYTN